MAAHAGREMAAEERIELGIKDECNADNNNNVDMP
jgi:hypothetical protein